ncbi:phage head spike fiber domain-containing protein [Vreelandella venusta]|uniref:phage head spike fiber domain-containing protein n=1 Tax=Vreelandella venusta TaxID=44935 RepID=UPI0020108CFC|nr:hypothetical protein [Halomonas venusta]UQI41943.1 hypothetical protein M3L73_06695 [Halomonas venusta]
MVDQVSFPPSIGGSGKIYTNDANPETGMYGGAHRKNFFPIQADMVAAAGYVSQYAQAIDGAKANADRAEDARAYVEGHAGALKSNILSFYKNKATLVSDFANHNFQLYDGLRKNRVADAEIWNIDRSTIGTYVDATGKIRTAAIDEPRYTYDSETGESLGVLSEEGRTNILLNTNDSSQWNLVGAISKESTEVINGIERVRLRIAAGQTGRIAFNYNGTIVGTYTASARVRVIDGWQENALVISMAAADGGFSRYVNPPANGDWGYIERTDTINGAGEVNIVRTAASHTADIVLEVEAQQMEQGLNRTSFIPTTTTAVARLPDNISRSLGNEFSDTEGTAYIDFSLSPDSTEGVIIRISDGTSDNRIQIYKRLSDGSLSVAVRSAAQDIAFFAAGDAPDSGKIAVSYNADGISLSVNGVSYVSSFSAPFNTIGSLTQVDIVNTSLAGAELFTAKDFFYLPTKITVAELNALTAGGAL